MFRKTKILIGLLIFTIIAIFFIDSIQYYYGNGKGYFSKHLPFQLKPAYWDWDLGNYGFRIEDSYEISVLGYNATINSNNQSVRIKQIISYSFDENKLVCLVQDFNNQYSYIVFSSNNNRFSNDFKIQIFKNENEFIYNPIKTIEVKTNLQLMKTYKIIYNYTLIIFVLILILLLRRLLLNIKNA